MLERIRSVLRIHGLLLPGAVRELFQEMGAEIDRLRSELDQVKTHQPTKE
jgi:hypothetical protein